MRSKSAALLCALIVLLLPLTASAQTQTITLTFAGDCTLGGDTSWGSDPGTFNALVEEHGYDYPFERMLPVFETDDLTMVNLEGVLQDDDSGRRAGRKYNFRGVTAYTEILRLGSIEAVNLGNNHTSDFGPQGVQSTQKALEGADIGYCLDEVPFVFECRGVRIAILGFNMDHYLSRQSGMAEAIAALRAEGCQAVVVNLHAGEEYNARHNRTQRNLAYHAIDSGADLVIGHHPHVLQGLEVYKQRTILYSLGELCFGGNRRPRFIERASVAARIALEFDESGYLSQTVTLLPMRISGTVPENNYQPQPASGSEAEETMERMQKDTPFPLNPYAEGEGARQETLRAR